MPLVIISDLFVAKYRDGEAHARRVASEALAQSWDAFSCVFPASMLDLVPAEGFTVESLGQAYRQQGLDEEAFVVQSAVN